LLQLFPSFGIVTCLCWPKTTLSIAFGYFRATNPLEISYTSYRSKVATFETTGEENALYSQNDIALLLSGPIRRPSLPGVVYLAPKPWSYRLVENSGFMAEAAAAKLPVGGQNRCDWEITRQLFEYGSKAGEGKMAGDWKAGIPATETEGWSMLFSYQIALSVIYFLSFPSRTR
jgi:hypothetical protein